MLANAMTTYDRYVDDYLVDLTRLYVAPEGSNASGAQGENFP